MFILSIILLYEAKHYGNYYLDLREGIISNGKWMLVTCVAGIYFLIYFSKTVFWHSCFLKNKLAYIGKRSMSIMLFHILSFSAITMIGVYLLHKPYSVSWANGLNEKPYYPYVNAFAGLMVPLVFDGLIERIWSTRNRLLSDKGQSFNLK